MPITSLEARPEMIRPMPSGEGRIPIRSAAVVNLNLLRFRLLSNQEEFPGFDYFADISAPESSAVREVVCVDLDRDPYDIEALQKSIDQTFRAKRFRVGFYLVHYFGKPAYLITRGDRFYVFGHNLERTVWPFFLKHILTMFAVDNGYVHLKSAAFSLPGTGGTLLVGRQRGGKSVFLSQACLAGADFLSNTHAMVKDGTVHGVNTSMRVRQDDCFGEVISSGRVKPHMEPGDFLASPHDLFPGRIARQAPLRNVVFVDYNPAAPAGFDPLEPELLLSFLEQFSLALSMYGLKEDLYDHCGGSLDQYAQAYQGMKDQLAQMVTTARCFRSNMDMLDADTRTRVLGILSS